jgi:metal-responsive CopG/Arc/MetJ family transcriptional regulator
MPTSKVRILVALPEKLLNLCDEAAATLQMSRVAFIRQAIATRLASYHRAERPMMMDLFKKGGGSKL